MRKNYARVSLALLMGSTCLIGLSAQTALAQANPAQTAPVTTASTAVPQDEASTVDEIIVTGYRRSLQNAAAARRAATNFTEFVTAEDIGKFPDLNLAESLQRVPGVQIARDSSSGEGTQVRIRGLGPSFTRVLLNGTPLNPATDGGVLANSNGREVDLNLLPTELFSSLEVSKSAQANQLEGGLSVVNLRPARAFDNPGQQFYVAASSNYSTYADEAGYGASAIYSNTWGNIGLVAGIVANERFFDNSAYWSSNWTNANLACPGCDNTQSNQFTFATSVPANSGNGLVTGTPIILATLLQLNPGVTGNQLTNGFLPRADRHSILVGGTERTTGLVSLEWRATDDLTLSFTAMGNLTDTSFDKANSNWYVRSSAPNVTGGMVPIGLVIDSTNVVRSGRFANSNFFSIQEDTDDESTFYHLNPTLVWNATDQLEVRLNAHYSRSELKRRYTQLWVTTLLNRGITATYDYAVGQEAPRVSFDFDVANPNSGIWTWEANSLTRESRDTSSEGVTLDLNYDFTPDLRVSAGVAYDDSGRSILAYQTAVTAALFSQIPQNQISNFLTVVSPGRALPNEGYSDFVTVDTDRVLASTNLLDLLNAAPLSLRTALGTNVGEVNEAVTAGYLQVTGRTELFSRDLRFDAGTRYVQTDQSVSGPINLGGVISFQGRESDYDEWLPSANLAYEVMDDLIVRAAASRTMTRPNPQQILPGTVITDATVQNATAGNPDLEPFFSENLDLGIEYYFGGSGYVSLNGFTKEVTGFPTTRASTVPFGDLGIAINSLLPFQQTAVNSAGGLTAPVIVSRPVNSEIVELTGFEAAWSQPLDFIMEGLGFNASYTYISDGDTIVPTAISPRIYNFIAYYDSESFDVRLSWVKQAERLLAGGPTSGFRDMVQKEAERSQIDISASYNFSVAGREARLSFDGVNITEERTDVFITDGTVRLPLTLNDPGAQYRLELSLNF